jgi:hypothetical protein
MKARLVILFVVLALLVSMLPMSSAFAHKVTPKVDVIVHNQTAGTITLTLTAKTGSYYFTFKPEFNSGATVPAGVYSYYLLTPCGYQHGIWSLTRTKQLTLYCAKEGREVNLSHKVP